MNYRTTFRAIPLLGLLGLGLLNTRCADQPQVKCTVTSGPTSARLTLVSQTGTCPDMTPPPLEPLDAAHVQAREQWIVRLRLQHQFGLEAYGPLVTDPNVNDEITTLAMKSGYIGTLVNNAESQNLTDPDTTHTPYALGKFDHVYPDKNNVCTASGFTPAEVNLPDVPAYTADDGTEVDEQPATHLKYEWSNVRAIVSADSIGTQVFADLTYTQDDCVTQYQVSLISPYAECMDLPDVTGFLPTDPAPPPTLEAQLCNSESDPSVGFPGSGIGLGIPITCDPDFGLCLPNKTSPTDKDTQ